MAHDRDIRALLDSDGDSAECVHRHFAEPISLRQIPDINERWHSSLPLRTRAHGVRRRRQGPKAHSQPAWLAAVVNLTTT